MKIGIIATDGGSHPPEKVAAACARQLVEIAPANNEGSRYVAALQLQLAIVEALTKHHADAQTKVRSALATDPAAHFTTGNLHDPGPRLDQAMADIQAASTGTPWEAEFAKPETIAAQRQVVGQSLVDIAHIERLWHADRNPGDALAAAYKAQPAGILMLSKEG